MVLGWGWKPQGWGWGHGGGGGGGGGHGGWGWGDDLPEYDAEIIERSLPWGSDEVSSDSTSVESAESSERVNSWRGLPVFEDFPYPY